MFNRLKYFIKLKKYRMYDRLLDLEVNAFKVQSIGDRNKVHKYMTQSRLSRSMRFNFARFETFMLHAYDEK